MEDICALCEKKAMMFCDSDQAKLCWDCDEKVHSANFLVAKHSRVLLCHLCHSPTPWKASGMKLTPTVSFCLSCVDDRRVRLHHLVSDEDGRRRQERDCVNDDRERESDDVFGGSDNDSDDSDDGDDEDEVDEDEDEDEEGDNQVVPTSSCSCSATSSVNSVNVGLKRLRDNSFSDSSSHDETASSSCEILSGTLPSGDESTSMKVLKRHRHDQRNY